MHGKKLGTAANRGGNAMTNDLRNRQRREFQLLAEVRRRFKESGYSFLQNLHCDCDGDSVVLTGQVESFRMKQMAQAIAGEVPGVKWIVNLTVVESGSPGRTPEYNSMSAENDNRAAPDRAGQSANPQGNSQ